MMEWWLISKMGRCPSVCASVRAPVRSIGTWEKQWANASESAAIFPSNEVKDHGADDPTVELSFFFFLRRWEGVFFGFQPPTADVQQQKQRPERKMFGRKNP